MPRTVITGADPCRAPARLRPSHQIAWNVTDFDTHECVFSVDGSPDVYLSLEYSDPSLLSYDPDHFDVDGHQITGDAEHGYTVLIGPQFQVGTKTLAPTVTFNDPGGMERVREIVRAVVEEYR